MRKFLKDGKVIIISLQVSWQQSLLLCCFLFLFISEWPLIRSDAPYPHGSVCSQDLDSEKKKSGREGAEDKQVYDLCLYTVALYGLLSQPVVPPGYLMLYYTSPPLYLSCLFGDQERGNEEDWEEMGNALGMVVNT